MGQVDYKKLDYDILIGRKARVCGRCKEEMAVTTECPKRVNSDNRYVCWHCCRKCTYAIKVPGGSQCSIKANKRKAEQEQRYRAKAEKKKKKASATDTDVGSNLFDSN